MKVPQATARRDEAIRLVRNHEPAQALQVAREADQPWYRCQALAFVGRYGDPADRAKIVEEAWSCAFDCADRYQTVAVAAWPLRAMVELQMEGIVARVNELLKLVPEIEPVASQSEALFWVWQAVFPLGPSVRSLLEDDLIRSCAASGKARRYGGWRARRNLREVIATITSEDPQHAREVLARMPDSDYKRQAARCFGETQRPRTFF